METVSSWRATYVPGRWVVLAGPTSVVIMQPAPAHMSGLLGDLWQDVVSAADVADLAEKFGAFRLDLMPHFAAFFWAEDGMHSLVRGALRAVDAETGEVVADGDGFLTWHEVGLQSVQQVRVEMDEPGDEPALALPLAVGVVLASSVTLDSTQKIPLVLPTVARATEEPSGAPEARATGEAVPVEGEAPSAEGETHETSEAEPAPVVPVVSLVREVPPAPLAGEAGPAEDAQPGIDMAEEPIAETAVEEPATEELAHGEDVPEGFAAEPSLPIGTHTPGQPEQGEEPVEEPSEGSSDENSDGSVAPSEPSSPGVSEPQADSWGVRTAEALAPVDLFVDEDHDGVPDAQQAGLDLDLQPAEPVSAPSALDVGEPEAPPAQGFPGFPGADVMQNQGGFLASPAPSGPPTGWSRPPQSPYGPSQPGQYGGQGVAAPGLPGAPYPQPPTLPGQPLPGQAYPGQPYPGQPFPGRPGQDQPGTYAQPPAYPSSDPYGSASRNGAPMTSPVPPPAAYAPAAPPPQGPGAPSEPGLPASADSADSDGTVFSTGIAMTHKPAASRQGGDGLILAVVCSFGHPNRPGTPRCRVCGQLVDNANPRLVHKPVLVQLVTAGGARVDVTDTVLIGRAPSAQPGDGNPILLPVPSPNSDISRTHVKVAVKDWDILATDLHSTNGTMLVRPGQAPVRMMPGTPVTVGPGTILDLGDGGVITVALPS